VSSVVLIFTSWLRQNPLQNKEEVMTMGGHRLVPDVLPATMRAMVLHEVGGDFQLEDRDVPRPKPDEVLIRVLAVGAGVTNELARNGVLGGSVPRIHGHELSGVVVALGSSEVGWSPGDLVTTSFYHLCGRCRWCASGRETLCDNFGGFIGIASDGAFADYVTLPGANLIPIPDGVDLLGAGIVGDAIATPYHVAAERLRMRAGDAVAVIGGGGGLGVHMLQIIRAFGGVPIAVERDPEKAAELERRRYAENVVIPADGVWAEDVTAAAGGRLAGVVDTVGNTGTLAEGFRALGKAGTLVVLGHVPGAEISLDPERVLLEELVVAGTRYATRAEIAKTMELVQRGRVVPVIGATYPLEQLNAALTAAKNEEVFGRIIIEVVDQGTYR
jgi:D-arabinose 1-dehydrogenase-like Zn-dependent alcohol dehydrogenase